MIDFNTLFQIKKDAISSIKSDSEGQLITSTWPNFLYTLFFILIPILVAVLPWFICIKLTEMASYISTGISIFTGLFFSLILNISSKIRIEKENINMDFDNFQRFKENMRQISNITQYLIILGILIMVVVFLNFLFNFNEYKIEAAFTSLALFLLIRFFVCLLFMLQRFYFVLRDEINNIL
ncbi:LTA synthase family protein [Belliella pelovolcani]|uniref:DUF2975 domain-containing protein n=1 Tax=Belliella pelovolcani TaxID=529505 RepID=A0A1N7Q2T2_9BACT|nr:hypothetical protein [Belliella pelovolcani]SIT17162.1 hypothetical protein SAMN05421761_12617 [Belliella pelovolcani]